MNAKWARTMAAYNQWMNQRLYEACAGLSDEVRKRDAGCFFRSIHGTLNHLLLADRIWLGRFTDSPFPVASLDQELFADFDELRAAREATDARIHDWATGLRDEDFGGTLRYTSLVNPQPRSYTLWVVATHFFNHQTHHRGQLTALLSQQGVDYGPTDLIVLPGVS